MCWGHFHLWVVVKSLFPLRVKGWDLLDATFLTKLQGCLVCILSDIFLKIGLGMHFLQEIPQKWCFVLCIISQGTWLGPIWACKLWPLGNSDSYRSVHWRDTIFLLSQINMLQQSLLQCVSNILLILFVFLTYIDCAKWFHSDFFYTCI
jgi:hypothetical protein